MITLNNDELIWAAGFFDGEGCTTSYKNHQFTPFVVVAQAGPKPLELLQRFQAAVGGLGKISGPEIRKKPNWTPVYRWQITGFEGCQAVIAMLWKYLCSVKREQAALRFKIYHERSNQSRLNAHQIEKIRYSWKNGEKQNNLARQYGVRAATIWEHTKDIEPEKCNFGHPRTPENRSDVKRGNRIHKESRCKQCQAEAYQRQKAKKKLATNS